MIAKPYLHPLIHFWLLDLATIMARITGLSKTHGELAGECKAMQRLPVVEIYAV